MRSPARPLRMILQAACLALLPAVAQAEQAPLGQAPILSLDQDALFAQSRPGKAALESYQAEQEALAAENSRIEATLEAEERALTARRETLPAAEFAVLAAEFDKKVEAIRAAQIAKPAELKRVFDAARQRFFEGASPILGQLMLERGAYVIIDKRAVVLGFDAIDMTADAIRRIDEAFARGVLPALQEAAPPASQPPSAPAEPQPSP